MYKVVILPATRVKPSQQCRLPSCETDFEHDVALFGLCRARRALLQCT